LFCWYISPDRNNTSSRLQRFIVITWIIFRRIVAFLGAGFGAVMIYAIWSSGSNSILYNVFSSLAVLAMSMFFVYVGVVGQGWVQHSFSDDVSLYKKIKKKYNID
jgi:hypothetical protein